MIVPEVKSKEMGGDVRNTAVMKSCDSPRLPEIEDKERDVRRTAVMKVMRQLLTPGSPHNSSYGWVVIG